MDMDMGQCVIYGEFLYVWCDFLRMYLDLNVDVNVCEMTAFLCSVCTYETSTRVDMASALLRH